MGTLLRRDMLLSKFSRRKSTGCIKEEPQSLLSRSPIDSPPTEKKLKCFTAFNTLSDSVHMLRSNTFPGTETPKSILKRRGSRLSEPGLTERRVQFNGDTFVQFINGEGEKKTSKEQLCSKPKDRKAFMNRNLTRISNSYHSEDNLDNLTTQVFTYQNSDSEGTHEVHVSFINDVECGTKLKMLVKVGCNFSPDEICVKANMSGNKIRVIATKMVEDETGCKKSEPFNERFLLPVEVDPYSVEARLDNKGNLTIEAPLMTHSKKTDIVKEQTESQNKSL